MNIFATDPDPKKSALALDDKRLVKMCLETAQILSTSLRFHGFSPTAYSAGMHKNHPVVKWACQGSGNYIWLLTHFKYLCGEYKHRFLRQHKCFEMWDEYDSYIGEVPFAPITPLHNSASNPKYGLDYHHIANTCEAYRLYLYDRWLLDKREPRWTNRGAPD